MDPAGRAFVRSLNILLKYSRLYGPQHTRAIAQYAIAWTDLEGALLHAGSSGLLLGMAGKELLVDGVPAGTGTAETSLAKLLSSAGIASIHFTSETSKEDLSKLQLALTNSAGKPDALAKELAATFGRSRSVRVNQVRFVATEDGKTPVLASQLAAAAFGKTDASEIQDWLNDPHKLLQAIAAVEGARTTGTQAAPTTGQLAAPVTGQFASPWARPATDTPGAITGEHSIAGLEEQELTLAFRMLAQWSDASTAAAASPGEDVSNLKMDAQRALRSALQSLSEKPEPDRPMLLQLAEHLAIRFALDRFERGDVQVNAVREMLDRMSKQMESLRKVLDVRERTMTKAGMTIESHAEILDRQFWATVPEKGKRSVLLSRDAWCIPARNIADYVDELVRRSERGTAELVLGNYLSCIRSVDPEARKKTAIGLSQIAETYGGFPGQLQEAISVTGAQIGQERDGEMQKLTSAAFVRLSQEAAARRSFVAVQQSLASVGALESKLPELATQLRPRLGVHDRLPEFVQEAIDSPSPAPDLLECLRIVPVAAAARLVQAFERSVRRDQCERLVALMQQLGPAAIQHLRDQLSAPSEADAVRSVGLLSRLDSAALEKELPRRLRGWQRSNQDAAIRQLASGAAAERGRLLLKLLDYADTALLPQIIDEIGLSGDRSLTSRLLSLAFDAPTGQKTDFLRVKAIEALGRIRELKAEPHLRSLVEAREFLHWKHPRELRVSAAQALLMLDPGATRSFLTHKGISQQELALGPLPAIEQCKWARQRRYARLPQMGEVTAMLSANQGRSRLRVEQLGLGGGLASTKAALSFGAAPAELDLRCGLQHIRAQVWLREERPLKFSFEILGIDLDDRSRLRRVLSGERLNIPAALFDRQLSSALSIALR